MVFVYLFVSSIRYQAPVADLPSPLYILPIGHLVVLHLIPSLLYIWDYRLPVIHYLTAWDCVASSSHSLSGLSPDSKLVI